MKTTNFNPDLGFNAATGLTSGTSTATGSGLTVEEEDGSPTVADVGTIEVPNGSLTNDGSGIVSLAYLMPTHGAKHTVAVLGNLGSTEVIDVTAGNYHTGTLNADCAIIFTGWTSGVLCEIGLRLTEDSTGGRTPTFSGVTWVGGTTPTHTTTALSVTDYVFWSTDGGTTIYGGQVGAASTSSSSTTTNHFHAVNEEHTGDGSSVTFSLANESEPDTIAAYVAGVRVDVTQATYDIATFASAPASFASVRFDYLAANS